MRTIKWVYSKTNCVKSLTVALALMVAFNGYSQSEKDEKVEQKNAVLARRQVIEKLRADHPNSWRDSLAVWRSKENYPKAIEQLEWYRTNSRIDTLREIDLSYAQLTEVPEFVFKADSLRMLILDWNAIRKLPKELAQLDSLKKIYWRNNDFKGKKPKVAKLKQVKKLSMDGNQLVKVPQFKRMSGLEVLELKKNRFEEIPISKIRKNKNLKNLAIGENPLKLSKAKYSKIDFLKVLKVNKSNLTSFDPSMYELVNLDEWQLQENKLKRIPDGISALKDLTKFSCYKNELESLPVDFFELEKLKVVDLYYNQLEVIPEAIGRLDSLEVLYLSYNELFSIPQELGELRKLRELYLHHNRISVLPGTLKNLDSLRVIRVNDNYLTEFPSSFLELASIKEVDVNKNELTTLPAEIEALSKLELFSFQDNSIELETDENAHIPYMIDRMIKRGVTCLPRIEQVIVTEE